jgi:hypothetical protein
MGAAVIACADVATAKANPATAINLIILPPVHPVAMSQLASTLTVPDPQGLCRAKVNKLPPTFADAELYGPKFAMCRARGIALCTTRICAIGVTDGSP